MTIKINNIMQLFLSVFVVLFLSGCLPSQQILQTMLDQRKITKKIYIKNDVDGYDTYGKNKKVLQTLKRASEYNIVDIKENYVRLEKNKNNSLKSDIWVSLDELETKRTYFLTLIVNIPNSKILINGEKYEPNKRLPEGNYKVDIKADKYLEKSLEVEVNKDINVDVTLDFDIEAEKKRIAIEKIKKQRILREKIIKEKLYVDKKQKLIWQDNKIVLVNKKPWLTKENFNNRDYNNTKGDTATTYCKKLTLGNFRDWRLPTKNELKNLFTQKNYLKNVTSDWYWSNTISSTNNELAWSIYFGNNDGYADFKNISNYVRCVRAK
jgi:hypothetical protein